jgi:hypothetical protein
MNVMNKPLLSGPLGNIPLFHGSKTTVEPLFLEDEQDGEPDMQVVSNG